MDRLNELLADHQDNHSDFQMSHFIVARQNFTPYGRYKQVLRELSKRAHGLRSLEAERDLLLVDIDELRESPWSTEFDQRRKEIHLRQKLSALPQLDRQIRDCTRELRHFYEIAVELKEQVGDLTPERRARLDAEHWRCRLKSQAAVEIVTSGRIAPNTLELLLSTPKEWREPILAEIRQTRIANGNVVGPLIDWLDVGDQNETLSPVSANSNGSSARPLPFESVILTGHE